MAAPPPVQSKASCSISGRRASARVAFAVSISFRAATLAAQNAGSNASINSEAIQLDFAGQGNSSGADPYDGTACASITISGCTFTNVITGIMPAGDRQITVFMTPDGADVKPQIPVDIEDYGTPLGVADSIVGGGEIIE